MFLREGQDARPGPVSVQAQQGAGRLLPSTSRLAYRSLQLLQCSGIPGLPLRVSARRMTIQAKEIDFYLFLNTKENRCSA